MSLEAVPAPATGPVAFDVVDVLAGFASLARRSPTLDGGVPIRVAQGCVPLLEGNAWGWQIALARRIELRRRLGSWSAHGPSMEHGIAELDRMTRAAVPMLLRDGTLRAGAWVKRLERGALDAGRAISLFTGLFVRPRAGWRLRVSTLANRRSWLYGIDEAILDDTDAYTPLMLEVVPNRETAAFVLDGQVATVGVLPAQTTFSRATVDEAPEIARAHVDFYDARYFATKKRGEVARKYRDDVVRGSRGSSVSATGTSTSTADTAEPRRDDMPVVHARVVDGGPSLVEPTAPARFHRSTGPIVAPAGTAPDRLVMRNAVAFTASFDGYTLTVEPDRAELERFADEVRSAWQRWQTASGAQFHEGALLYLTKYVTPHPPGEPHFFVKPPALIETSSGTSTLLDGRPGPGFDILRGVVRTDGFHAAPAVFHLWRPGETIRVARGAPLVEMFVFPRSLDEASFTAATAGPGGAWS